jgi:hypothetical protein
MNAMTATKAMAPTATRIIGPVRRADGAGADVAIVSAGGEVGEGDDEGVTVSRPPQLGQKAASIGIGLLQFGH